MSKYEHILKTDYDKRVKLGDNYVFCYSKKKLTELYPDESGYSRCGEAWRGTGQSQDKYEEKQRKRLEKLKESGKADFEKTTLKVGDLHMGGSVLGVYPKGTNEAVLSKADGYVCVGENRFIALHSSRIPFFAAVGSLSVAIIATVIIIAMILGNAAPPVVIAPDNPLPVLDPNIVPVEDDTSEKVFSEVGGGSVSMVYTKEATVRLKEGIVKIYFQNPNSSNHDVVVELYVMSGEEKYFLGRSGLVPAGSAIYELSIENREAELKEGIYEGRYQVSFYNPLTGEKAIIGSNISGVTITVTE